ncbi:MAG: hypothetical protein O3A51_01055 [Verrucomicrobia bacterium]|nr:hypothetical protein [Verrucomicrobiota bacterium]
MGIFQRIPTLQTSSTNGGRLAIQFDPTGRYNAAYMSSSQLRRDWSDYDALVVDVVNPTDRPITARLLIADQAWADNGHSYWNRHNAERMLPPGQTPWRIPVRGLFRGESGSRNNDIKRNIDPESIVRIDLGFGRPGESGSVLINGLYLLKSSRPLAVQAFDFGPPDQAVMPGWIPVSHESLYTPDRKYGWGPAGGAPWKGAARDTAFGSMLLRDFCEGGSYRFRVDTAPGAYKLVVYYENSGYWGGEQASQARRTLIVNGQVSWIETRDDAAAHSLYRFENIDPVDIDVWDAYMAAELARPVVLEIETQEAHIDIDFRADKTWGSKISALAIVPHGDADAEAWLRNQQDLLASEFRGQAICLDEPIPHYAPTNRWVSTGLAVWPVTLDETITPASLPDNQNAQTLVKVIAVRGEFEPLSLALRPLQPLGECRVTLEPFSGPSTLAATVDQVHYLGRRSFDQLAYRTLPHSLRPVSSIDLSKTATRQVIVTANVPESALPGIYTGALLVHAADGRLLNRTALQVEVSPVVLDRTSDFQMGFFGMLPPDMLDKPSQPQILAETLDLLKRHGMNSVCAGPAFAFTDTSRNNPTIDFEQTDRFFNMLREHGFTRPVLCYGGGRLGGIASGYARGAAGLKLAADWGMDYTQALWRAWSLVDTHAREHQWPTLLYNLCDETRVAERARDEHEFMTDMAAITTAFPGTVRTAGAYGVSFATAPTDDVQRWHRRFFETLDVSILNGHDQSTLAEARKLGKSIHIYNQGRTRYSFGLYQWAEQQKGVTGRWEWHLNILHGYQFFDLDGREPDTAMMVYGRGGIYPTIDFERCREGAEEFYLLTMLSRSAKQRQLAGTASPALAEAIQWLDELNTSVAINQRVAPDWYDASELKIRLIGLLERL